MTDYERVERDRLQIARDGVIVQLGLSGNQSIHSDAKIIYKGPPWTGERHTLSVDEPDEVQLRW